MTDLRAVPHVRTLRWVSLLTAVLAAGCVQQRVRPQGELVAVAPQLSVERFLQASNARDYAGMARLFGTTDGPIGDPGNPVGCGLRTMVAWVPGVSRCMKWQDVELWMATLSEVLRYQDYRIVSERMEPGRGTLTNRIGVDLNRGGTVVTDVPFLVVRTGDGRWLVQEIAIERITGS